ncbi:MAG: cytochrome b/b6 domain-containing protein [Halieaceae bacterium]
MSFPTWDAPTRLFHWLLLLALLMSWLSHEFEWIKVHLWSGYTVLVLVCFRIAWGFFGSRHSRFASFLRKPAAVWRYWRGVEQAGPGHNPAGGWAVLLMLLLILLQALSGLFNSDGLMFDGPLYHALDSRWTDKLGELHAQLFWWVILGLIGLHLLAVSWYQWVRGQALIQAMFTGGEEGSDAPVSNWRAALLLLICIAALALAVYLAPEPELYW